MMDRHWVGIQCEASGASEATPAVAEASKASKATCNYNPTHAGILITSATSSALIRSSPNVGRQIS